MPTFETSMGARNGYFWTEPIYRRCTKMPVPGEKREAFVDTLKVPSLAVVDRFVLVTPDDRVCMIAADKFFVQAEDGMKPLPVQLRLERNQEGIHGSFVFSKTETIQGRLVFHSYGGGDEELHAFAQSVDDLSDRWTSLWRTEMGTEPNPETMLYLSLLAGLDAVLAPEWDEDAALQAIGTIFNKEDTRSSGLRVLKETPHFVAREAFSQGSL